MKNLKGWLKQYWRESNPEQLTTLSHCDYAAQSAKVGSDGFNSGLVIPVRVSRLRLLLSFSVHTAGLIAVGIHHQIDTGLAAALSYALLLSLLCDYYRMGLIPRFSSASSNCLRQLQFSNGTWRGLFLDGTPAELIPQGDAYTGRWFAVLRFSRADEQNGWGWIFRRRISVVIGADTVTPATYRRLCVRLRHGAVG